MLTILIFAIWLLGVFAFTFMATRFLKDYLAGKNILDNPNHRSSHTVPTPRGGGLAILFGVIPSLVFCALLAPLALTKPLLMLIGGMLLLGTLSWSDDVDGLSAKTRLLGHIAVCFVVIDAFAGKSVFHAFMPYHLEKLIVIFGWVWFINLYNFMDGIDGITVVETISVALGAVIVLLLSGAALPVFVPHLILVAAVLAFGFFNWSPAKIFLGDVGSVTIGFMVGWILIGLVYQGLLEAAAILPLYYIVDSGYTILKRLRRGENIMQAHREHFYQKATDAGWSHSQVSKKILGCNIVLIGLAISSLYLPFGLAFLLSMVFIPFFVQKILLSPVKV